jgi:predicted DNA-binding protein (MmcQ/YjbR family)
MHKPAFGKRHILGKHPGVDAGQRQVGAHVWKVGGKVFAIGGWQEDAPSFTFKVSDIAYEMLKEQPGLRPASYLASRGMKWIQHFAKPGLSDVGLRDYIRQSHAIVSQGLSKKKRIALGLAPGAK